MPMSHKELGKIVESFGYKQVPSKKSHVVYVKTSNERSEALNISIPKHKEISMGVLHQIARKLGLTVKELEALR